MSITGRSVSAWYKDLLQIDNSNSGVDSTLRTVKSDIIWIVYPAVFLSYDADLSSFNKGNCKTWDTNGTFSFSLQSYYAAALTKMLTETPIKPITETKLSKLDRRIGQALVSIVPQPVEDQVTYLKDALP